MSSLPEPLARFRTELEDAIRRELEAQARSHGRGARVLRAVRRRPGRALLAVSTVAAATAVALFVSTPWKSSPGFLEEVQAAIAPRAGTVLHVKILITDRRPARCKVRWAPVEYWIDQTPPYKSRGFESVKGPDICKPGTQLEIGQEGISKPVLVFRPPNRLEAVPSFRIDPDASPDPAANLRRAIEKGTAHHEGTTVIDGRRFERIRIDCDRARSTRCESTYTYVDPKTFQPRRTVHGDGRFVSDYVTYEHLPGTPANRALADIRAQHPNATGP
jgi:hypothetical protein